MSNFDIVLSNQLQLSIETLMAYCRLPSITISGEAVDETTNFVETLLQKNGFSTQQLKVDGAPPYILAEQKGQSDFTLLLYNHYDVQPVGHEAEWSSQPFSPVLRDGNLYARGVADNKGELIARLLAIQALREIHGELPITIRWIIEGEEELGSPHFGAFLDRYSDLCRADGCLWEGAGFTRDGRAEISLGKKGLLYLRLKTQKIRVDAHSGLAGIMPSAAWELIQALSSLREADGTVCFDGFYDDVVSPTAEQLAAIADQPDYGSAYQSHLVDGTFVDNLSGDSLREVLFLKPTCNVTGLSSGYDGNGIMTIVPAQAQADLDFRLVPNQDPHKIAHAIRTHLDKFGFENIELDVKAAIHPVAMEQSMPLAQTAREVLTSALDRPPIIIPISEKTLPLVSILKEKLGIPGIGAPTNPIYPGSNQHGPNEHIRLEDFTRAAKISFELFKNLNYASGGP